MDKLKPPVKARDVFQELDEIKDLLQQLVNKKRAARRKGHRRTGCVADRVAASIEADPTYRPTELQLAYVRRKLLG